MPKRGEKAKDRVERSLKSSGAKVDSSPGSRTKIDIEAKWPTGKHWLVQVKYSPRRPAGLSIEEKRALKPKLQGTEPQQFMQG